MAFSLEPTEITQIVRLVAIMYVLSYKVDTKSSDMLNKNTWDVKKVRGQQLKALISNKAKKSVNESAT